MSEAEAGKLGWLKSKETRDLLYQKIRNEYNKNPKKCKFCGKDIPYERRSNCFCSKSHAASFNNKGKIRNLHGRSQNFEHNISRQYVEKRSAVACQACGKIFKEKIHGQKFCSVECSALYRKQKHFLDVNNHIRDTGCFPCVESGITKGEVNRRLVKTYLEDKFGHKCSICGNTEWMGKPIPLVVDHIDGDPYNCKVDNFRLVCGNCDMQLDTYKGKNFGHGRSWRKRYTKTVDKQTEKS